MPTLLSSAAPDSRAALALADQLERGGRDFGLSLDALWRSVGSPPNESPEDWLRLAPALADAVTSHRRRVVQAVTGLEPAKAPAVWTVTARLAATINAVLPPADAEVFAVGDHLAGELLATAYSLFLDHRGDRRPFTESGKLRRSRFLAMVGGYPPFQCVDPVLEEKAKTPSIPIPAPPLATSAS